MDRTIEIQSARDGMTLTLCNFVAEDDSHLSESFLVAIRNSELHAEARASSFMAPNLGEYFQDLAQHWQGWPGEKHWSTLEREFELSATTDSVGHVRLAYALRPADTGHHWQLSGALEIESGQLAKIANLVSAVWPS